MTFVALSMNEPPVVKPAGGFFIATHCCPDAPFWAKICAWCQTKTQGYRNFSVFTAAWN
jgi:hypothetical protein